MKREEIEKVYKKIIESTERSIEWSNKEIEWLNKQIKRSKEEDKKLVEYVWSKGVLERMDMEVFGKDFIGAETKDWLKQRDRQYRSRAKDRKRLENYKKTLTRLMATF